MALPNFNLLDLPFLPRDRIIRLVRPIDLLSLSRCSKKWKRIVEEKLKATYSFLRFSKEDRIELQFQSGEKVTWWIKERHFLSNGNEIDSTRPHFDFVQCPNPANPDFESTFLFLCSIFPIRTLDSLTVDRSLESWAVQFCELYQLDNWKLVALKCDSQHRSHYPYYCCPLYGINADTTWIEIRFQFSQNQDNNVMFSRKNIYIADGRFLRDSDIISLSCEITSIRLVKPRFEAVNGFIHQWLQSQNMKLKYLHLCMEGGRRVTREKYNVVLNSVNYRSWDRDCRPRYYPLSTEIPLPECEENEGSRFDLKDGKDIRRDDGTLATVIIVNFYDVYMFVWHNQDPGQH